MKYNSLRYEKRCMVNTALLQRLDCARPRHLDRCHPATGDAKSKAETRRRAFNRAVSDAALKGLMGTRDIGAITFIWLEVPHENA